MKFCPQLIRTKKMSCVFIFKLVSSNKTSKLKPSARTEQLKFLFSLELHSLDKVQSYAADPYNMYNLLK